MDGPCVRAHQWGTAPSQPLDLDAGMVFHLAFEQLIQLALSNISRLISKAYSGVS